MNKLQLNQDRWQPGFDHLLCEEGLSNRGQFLQPLDEFDEIPLYTRTSRLLFLDDAEHEERNILLLGYALQYADSVVELVASQLDQSLLPDFFLMVIVMGWEDYCEGELIRPCFWTTRRARTELRQMQLKAVYSEPAKRIKAWIERIGGSAEYEVADYATECTDNALMRVHIGHTCLPSEDMPTIKSLIVT